MATRRKKVAKKVIKPNGTCGKCKNCTPLTEFHTLSLRGTPTLGICPYWTRSKAVLLNFDVCDKFEATNDEKGL